MRTASGDDARLVQAGRHFDPARVDHFISVLPQVLGVRDRFQEEG